MITVKGHTCCNGMKILPDPVEEKEDDLMVKRFRAAGAIIVGTTVMTEFGRCPLGYNSLMQGTFNPYNETRYSGGSSSGSVVSVMTGLVPIAISFDGGGSIRLPAAMSGSFGLAPTFGRVPFDSVVARSMGMIKAGVNTATTTDTALAYALLAQNEPGHYYTKLYDGGIHGPPRPHLSGFDCTEDLSGIKIGVFWDYLNDADPEIVSSCKVALKEMEKRGATLVDVTIPHLKLLSLSHGMSISMDMASMHDHDFYNHDNFEPGTMIQIGLGKTMTGSEFLAANRMRGWSIQYLKTLFGDKMDVFVTPGCPITAPLIPKAALACGESNTPLFVTVMRYIFLANLCGFPGMSVPIAYSKEDILPISLHLMADHWNEPLLLRLSHFLEKKVLKRQQPKHFVKLSLEAI